MKRRVLHAAGWAALTVLACCAAQAPLFADEPAAAPAPNLCRNGDFRADVEGWGECRNVVEGGVATTDLAPKFISYETKDAPEGAKGCMRVAVKLGEVKGPVIWNTGVFANCAPAAPARTAVKITFVAKSVSGARILHVTRRWGGSDDHKVTLTDQWRPYEINAKTGQYPWGEILFSLTSNEQTLSCAEGEYLLGNVRVEVVPAEKKEPVQ